MSTTCLLTSTEAGEEWAAMPDEPDNSNPTGATGEPLPELDRNDPNLIFDEKGNLCGWIDVFETYTTRAASAGRMADEREG